MQKAAVLLGRQRYSSLQNSLCSRGGGKAFRFSLGENREVGPGLWVGESGQGPPFCGR